MYIANKMLIQIDYTYYRCTFIDIKFRKVQRVTNVINKVKGIMSAIFTNLKQFYYKITDFGDE